MNQADRAPRMVTLRHDLVNTLAVIERWGRGVILDRP